MNFLHHIEQLFPLSYQELKTYFDENHNNKIIPDLSTLLNLPFIFSVGIWIDFFKANGIDLDTQSLNLVLIEESVTECLSILEKSINHYS